MCRSQSQSHALALARRCIVPTGAMQLYLRLTHVYYLQRDASITVYVSTPTASLTLMRTASELVDFEARVSIPLDRGPMLCRADLVHSTI